ncbi:MAG: Crp/Fnr family transcriptional regulator [Candidatus Dojkabacteria bacterium]
MLDFGNIITNDVVTIIGYVASILVGITFLMKTMIPLRRIAIASNIAFITYGFFGQLYPVLILHLFLFPLNIYRLIQMQNLIKKVKQSSQGGFSFDWMVKYMTKESFKNGDIIFKKGDPADKMYYIQSGNVRLGEVGVVIGAGQVMGEMGIFSPFNERTAQAIAVSDIVAYSITQDKIMQLYYQNPSFGFYLVQLLTKRFIEDLEKKSHPVPEDGHLQPKDKLQQPA